MYGISFPDKKQLAEYKVFLEEAARRDHRKIGRVCLYAAHPLVEVLTTMYAGTRTVLLQRPQSWKLFLPPAWYSCLQRAPGAYASKCFYSLIYFPGVEWSQSEYFKRGYQEGTVI